MNRVCNQPSRCQQAPQGDVIKQWCAVIVLIASTNVIAADRFEEMGSIRDERGRHQAVRMELRDRLRISAVSQADIDAARQAPLTGRCRG